MSSKWYSLGSVAAVLMACGIALGNQPSVAEAKTKAAPSAEVNYSTLSPTAVEAQPTQVFCNQVACSDDSDCVIQGCSNRGCSHPAPGQAFGRCIVPPP